MHGYSAYWNTRVSKQHRWVYSHSVKKLNCSWVIELPIHNQFWKLWIYYMPTVKHSNDPFGFQVLCFTVGLVKCGFLFFSGAEYPPPAEHHHVHTQWSVPAVWRSHPGRHAHRRVVFLSEVMRGPKKHLNLLTAIIKRTYNQLIL